jgi:superfamily I DNA/RNA helicase
MVAVAQFAAGGTVDSAQETVICADPSARLVVEAGPGTGKTAVACARVGFLIRNGIEPTNILLISFTRTAVREMRDRIAGYLADPRDAAAIRISTIDSFSWRFWTGFLRDEIEDPFAGYEQTIDQARRMLQQRHPDLVEYLAPLRQVLVDEAQDLTGARLNLVQELNLMP